MDMEFVLKMVGLLEVWTSYRMKRLLFVPLIFLINLPIFGKNIDPRIIEIIVKFKSTNDKSIKKPNKVKTFNDISKIG